MSLNQSCRTPVKGECMKQGQVQNKPPNIIFLVTPPSSKVDVLCHSHGNIQKVLLYNYFVNIGMPVAAVLSRSLFGCCVFTQRLINWRSPLSRLFGTFLHQWWLWKPFHGPKTNCASLSVTTNGYKEVFRVIKHFLQWYRGFINGKISEKSECFHQRSSQSTTRRSLDPTAIATTTETTTTTNR
ncbi:unknown protein [Seminavis robusta]|uniref:Uncharacterized protein n=1 Tax=Seminavis robusta TaxID=568900 RepID=A0A9N8HDF9_9STRA|nr:unknown protein [Seminavis robusta]|eukprot:Sro358_g125881.1  (184) ;mRNA; f:35504-36055